jgi:hypothetical protein
MMSTVKRSIKDVPIREVEEAIAVALSRFSEFHPSTEIRSIELVGEPLVGLAAKDTYRIEMRISFPKYDPDAATELGF